MERNDGDCLFEDALTHCIVEVRDDGCRSVSGAASKDRKTCSSLFFPGCSFLNFAPRVLRESYRLLEDLGCADGISFLCCGKLLAYEPDALQVVPAFERQLAAALAGAGVDRIVAACPNCVQTLRSLLDRHLPEAGIDVQPLSSVLAEAGIRIKKESVEAVAGRGALVAVHDSCPDRSMGEFSASVRAMLPADVLVETRHNRATSFCCGALLRAEGRNDAAIRASEKHGQEASAVGARLLVTYCISCAQQLSLCQEDVPVHHYLELLFDQPVNWREVGGCMTTRFLFEEAHGVRDYAAMDAGGER